jgi:hypothetical protein
MSLRDGTAGADGDITSRAMRNPPTVAARTTPKISRAGGADAKGGADRRTNGAAQGAAENTKLLEQREVSRKSLGIVSEVPPSSMPESRK